MQEKASIAILKPGIAQEVEGIAAERSGIAQADVSFAIPVGKIGFDIVEISILGGVNLPPEASTTKNI